MKVIINNYAKDWMLTSGVLVQSFAMCFQPMKPETRSDCQIGWSGEEWQAQRWSFSGVRGLPFQVCLAGQIEGKEGSWSWGRDSRDIQGRGAAVVVSGPWAKLSKGFQGWKGLQMVSFRGAACPGPRQFAGVGFQGFSVWNFDQSVGLCLEGLFSCQFLLLKNCH